MPWTIYKYLSRDLAKSALLAVLALTVVMSLFGIIEPLRTQQGLGPMQVLRLFWYLVPVMLSLTLPIAALFSATIVYGRFSMDNELTACRASGIPMLALLKPAMVMGVLVTAATLGLSNWVAPRMAKAGEQVVKANLKGLIFEQLATKGFWSPPAGLNTGANWVVHADRVDAAQNAMYGVVAMDVSDKEAVEYVAMPAAGVQFTQDGDDTYVSLTLIQPVTGGAEQPNRFRAESVPFGPIRVPPLLSDDPSFYTWQMLQRVREDPQLSPTVRQRLEDIRRQLHEQNLYEDAKAVLQADASEAGQPYELFDDAGARYVLQLLEARPLQAPAGGAAPAAARAVIEEGQKLTLFSAAGWEPRRQVRIEVFDPRGEPLETILAERAVVQVRYNLLREDARIEVRAADVEWTLHQANVLDEAVPLRERRIGPLNLPPDVREASAVTLEELTEESQRKYPAPVRRAGQELRRYIEQRLELKVAAEMHGRLAYGIGCFLLVAIGAVLGLIYRGGQVLSAFGLSCIPAMVLIILTIMGRQLISNPDVPEVYGVAVIWGGVSLLTGVTSYLYGVTARR